MLQETIEFLVLLSPFALFLYLEPVMKDLTHREFVKVLLQATLISFLIFSIFLLTGSFIFREILDIDFEAFRIFGGIIIFTYAFQFIVRGERAFFHLKGTLNDLAAEIALPFLVGAATISQAIVMGNKFSSLIGMGLLVLILAINFLIIMFLKYFRDSIRQEKFRIAFDKNMEVLLRLNGFFIGAIGVNMVVMGITRLFF